MRIEVGKSYKMRDGGLAHVTGLKNSQWPFRGHLSGTGKGKSVERLQHWYEDGGYVSGGPSAFDLIELNGH